MAKRALNFIIHSLLLLQCLYYELISNLYTGQSGQHRLKRQHERESIATCKVGVWSKSSKLSQLGQDLARRNSKNE